METETQATKKPVEKKPVRKKVQSTAAKKKNIVGQLSGPVLGAAASGIGSVVKYARTKPKTFLNVVLALGLLLVTVLYVTADTRGPSVHVPANLSELSAEKQDRIKSQVLGSLEHIMVLPGDTPFMAVVDNAEVLRTQQAFYAGSQDGDVLLVFEASNRAVIYRPSEKRIINAGSLVTE